MVLGPILWVVRPHIQHYFHGHNIPTTFVNDATVPDVELPNSAEQLDWMREVEKPEAKDCDVETFVSLHADL